MDAEENETYLQGEGVDLDRGKGRRFSLTLPVEYCPPGRLKGSPGITENIGGDGMRLSLNEEVEVGQNMALSLFIDDGLDFQTVDLLVEVVGTAPGSETGRERRTEVRYLDIAEESMGRLRKFLHSLESMNVPLHLP